MKKRILALAGAVVLTLSMTMTAFATPSTEAGGGNVRNRAGHRGSGTVNGCQSHGATVICSTVVIDAGQKLDYNGLCTVTVMRHIDCTADATFRCREHITVPCSSGFVVYLGAVDFDGGFFDGVVGRCTTSRGQRPGKSRAIGCGIDGFGNGQLKVSAVVHITGVSCHRQPP